MERTGRNDSSGHELAAASELAEELGGLPLALEQAAAYIDANRTAFHDFLASYREKRLELFPLVMAEDRSNVVTTWKLNFSAVEKASRAAGDILLVSALLHPDQIPLELFLLGAAELGPSLSQVLAKANEKPLRLDELLGHLERYSLINIDEVNKTFSVHRLVREVLRRDMEVNDRRLWAERVIRALNHVFPQTLRENWPQCQRLLNHVKEMVEIVDELVLEFEEAGRLLHEAGQYCVDRQKFSDAEPLCRRALTIQENTLGLQHPKVIGCVENLALIYRALRSWPDALAFCQRSVDNQQELLGAEHPNVAKSLNSLALVYVEMGRYGEAKEIHLRALDIRERTLEPGHRDIAQSLHNLAVVYRSLKRYPEAEKLHRRDLEIRESVLGPDHPDVAISLSNLALLYVDQDRLAEAEPLFQRALAIRDLGLGSKHPDLLRSLNNLLRLYKDQSRFDRAEPLYERIASLLDDFDPEDPVVAMSLDALAGLRRAQKRLKEAEPLYRRALEIRQRRLPATHPEVAQSLHNLGRLYQAQSRKKEAEDLYRRALAIYSETMGEEHSYAAIVRHHLAQLYRGPSGHDESPI